MSWHLKTDPSGLQGRWSDEAAARYRAAGYWRESTLTDVARAAVRDNPDRALAVQGDRALTRRGAWDEALRLCAFFRERGLVPGDVVSMQLPNWLEACVVALATRMMGLILNPIPPIYRGSELAYILADCRAKAIFIPTTFRKHDFEAMIAQLRPGLPLLRDVIRVRGEGPSGYAAVAGRAPLPEQELPRVDPGAMMMVMYTSGTTGRPKGVLHTHYNYDYRIRGMGEAWSIGPDDVIFMPSPVSHITGAFWAFDMPWVRGCCSVLLDVWTPEEGLLQIEKHGCTVSGGATPFLQQLVDLGRERPEALSSLRLFFCGGTTVSPQLIRTAGELFPHCLFFRAYGSTEMSSATVGISERGQRELGAETDGGVVYPTEVKIVDPATGEPVPDGEEGEIAVRGPEGFVGYLHPADNTEFDGEGYFRMGDLGRRVHGNYLVITGRKKDIIIRSGENISPKEVEDALADHPAIAEVSIVAMPSAATGEKGCAFVIPRAGKTVDLPDIRRFLDGVGMARQKYPEHLVVVDDLPRVPSGKVRKDVLRATAREIAAREAAG